MKLRALVTFNDLKAGVTRREGEVWEADESRLAELSSTEWGALAEAVEEPAPKPARRARKKA